MMKNKRAFINSAIIENNVGKIEMYGDVYEEIPIDWWTGQPICEQAITLKDFKEALNQIANCSTIEIHLNSYGGDANVGRTIHNLLKATNKKTVCIVEGIAASAAFTIATGCDEVRVYPGSIMMCHKTMAILFGYYNNEDLQKVINGNEACDKASAAMYAQKSGMSETQCLNLMAKETWMAGKEAIEYGFADTLINGDAQVQVVNKSTIKINGIEHKNLNIPQNILNKIDGQNLGGEEMSLIEKFQNHCANFFQNLAEDGGNVQNETKTETTVEAPATKETDKAPGETGSVEAPKTEKTEAPETVSEEKMQAMKTEFTNAERTRLQEIDKISSSIDADLVQEAKYGKTACDAKELAMRQMQREAQKTNTALSDMQADSKNSKANSITSEPPKNDVTEKENERAEAIRLFKEKMNKAKGGK